MVRVLASLAIAGAVLATMTAVMGFPSASTALNTVMRGATVMLIGLTLFGIGKPITEAQRVGMAMIGSGMIMTSTTFFDPNSPFTSWSFLLAGGGLLVYLIDTYGHELWDRMSRWDWK